MTTAPQEAVESFVRNLGTELPQTEKPLSLPVCLKAIQSAEEATDPFFPKSLDFSLGSGRIKKLATFVKEGEKGSNPTIKHQAQSVADMVTKLHVFGELSLKDRSDFLDAAPFSLRNLGLRVYDFGRRIWNLFRGTSDDFRTDGVNSAIDVFNKILVQKPDLITKKDDLVRLFKQEFYPESEDQKEVYASFAIKDSFSKDVQQMSVEELQDLATFIEGKENRRQAYMDSLALSSRRPLLFHR